MRLLATLLLLLVATVAVADPPDPPVEDRVDIRFVCENRTVHVHQEVRVVLLLSLDEEFLGLNMVPLFRRETDLPVLVRAPGLPGEAGSATGESRETLALNDDVVTAVSASGVGIAGRKIRLVEIARVLRPTTPGEIVIPAPSVHFAYGTEFEDDLLEGRRALDRREASVIGDPLTIRVLPLPEEGRPAGFTGAVGRFTVSASVSRESLARGETLALTLVFEGEGDLAGFGRPDLQGLTGFHVYGAIDDRDATRRTIRYDLAPVDEGVTEIPAIPFAFYDPASPAGYRTIRTRPIPLRVTPGEGGPAVRRPEPEGTVPDGLDREPGFPVGRVVGLTLVIVAVIGLLIVRRIRRRDRPNPADLRALEAAAVFRRAVAGADADLAEAFTEYLSANLRCPHATVISPDLPEKLTTAGVASDTAARVASLLEDLVGSRYGGHADEAEGVDRARGLVEDLERVFRRADEA